MPGDTTDTAIVVPVYREAQVIGRVVDELLATFAAVYCVVVFLIPKPATVKPEGWRLLGIFCATIAGLILEPVPQGALVLTGVVIISLKRTDRR